MTESKSWTYAGVGILVGIGVGWLLRGEGSRERTQTGKDWRVLFDAYEPPIANYGGSPPRAAWAPWMIAAHPARQKVATPVRWREIAPPDSGEVEVEGSSWRCAYGPMSFSPGLTNGYDKPAAYWILSRRVKCSNDGWNSYVQGFHSVIMEPDGSVKCSDEMNLSLAENGQKEPTQEIMLRPAKGA